MFGFSTNRSRFFKGGDRNVATSVTKRWNVLAKLLKKCEHGDSYEVEVRGSKTRRNAKHLKRLANGFSEVKDKVDKPNNPQPRRSPRNHIGSKK